MSHPGSRGQIARGFKAVITNPDNLEEAKERASESLQEMEKTGVTQPREACEDKIAISLQADLHAAQFSAMMSCWLI